MLAVGSWQQASLTSFHLAHSTQLNWHHVVGIPSWTNSMPGIISYSTDTWLKWNIPAAETQTIFQLSHQRHRQLWHQRHQQSIKRHLQKSSMDSICFFTGCWGLLFFAWDKEGNDSNCFEKSFYWVSLDLYRLFLQLRLMSLKLVRCQHFLKITFKKNQHNPRRCNWSIVGQDLEGTWCTSNQLHLTAFTGGILSLIHIWRCRRRG